MPKGHAADQNHVLTQNHLKHHSQANGTPKVAARRRAPTSFGLSGFPAFWLSGSGPFLALKILGTRVLRVVLISSAAACGLGQNTNSRKLQNDRACSERTPYNSMLKLGTTRTAIIIWMPKQARMAPTLAQKSKPSASPIISSRAHETPMSLW